MAGKTLYDKLWDAHVVRDNGDGDDSASSHMNTRLLDAAVELAESGLKVFALAPRAKVPHRGSTGFRDATTDTVQIHEWWSAEPNANIGVRTSGLAVVDLDLYHPGSAQSWGRLLNLTYPESLPETWVSQTGRGGEHYWYQLTDTGDRFLKNGYASCLPINGEIVSLPHIDLKCSGGSYVVAPPSVLPEGAYRWLERDLLTKAPEWLSGPPPPAVPPTRVHRLSRIVGSAKRVASICEIVATASIGKRNDTLNWGAFHMAEVVIAGALQPQQAHDALLEAAIAAGLPQPEAKRTIRSAFKAKGI